MRPLFALGAPLLLAACGSDEMQLHNRLSQAVGLEIRAPKDTLRGGCDRPFATRFCREEYEAIGVVDVAPEDSRTLTLSDGEGDGQCTRILWLRLVFLEEVGPVDDEGTLIALPAEAAIESGAGALHTVAFPQGTVRIDELGATDPNQARPPPTCAELGRAPG